MTGWVENEFGVEYDNIKIKYLRLHRINGRWLIEYRRQPRWPFGLDRWWWFNDGTYISYDDAMCRIEELKDCGYLSIARFQKMKVIQMESEDE